MVYNEKNHALQFIKHFYAQYLLHCNIGGKMCLKGASCFGKCSTKLNQRLGVQVLPEFIGFLVVRKDTRKDCQMNSSPGFETDNV